MLCLRADYILSVICPQTLLGVKIYSKSVLDFAINESNNNLCQILMLTHDTNCITRTLHMVSYPGTRH